MDNKKIAAIAVVIVLVVVAVAAAMVMVGKDTEDYRSKNTDGRLQILGNANNDDYLDSLDVDRIHEIIANGEPYYQLADANNDGKIDEEDAKMVQNIIDIRESNKGKAVADMQKYEVNYISALKNVMTAHAPFDTFILAGSGRHMDIMIALGLQDRMVGVCHDDNGFRFSDPIYAPYAGVTDIGLRTEPNLEIIEQLKADAVFTGSSTYCKNISGNKAGSTDVIRLNTWENGGLQSGALMLGFFAAADKEAYTYVKWLDDLEERVNAVLDTIPGKDATTFVNLSSPTYMGAQSDGVSSALTRTGATNIGNNIVTSPTAAGGSVANYKEQIIEQNPEWILLASSIDIGMSQEDIDNKFYGRTGSWASWDDFWSSTNAYKNGNMVLINYGLPFPIITLIGGMVLFPEYFSDFNLEDTIMDYMTQFVTLPSDYTYQEYHFLSYPLSN